MGTPYGVVVDCQVTWMLTLGELATPWPDWEQHIGKLVSHLGRCV